MRCKNCNIEIEEYETFCNRCKKELKKTSSRRDVKELEKLIENQKKLNDLDNTKELVNLDVLVKEELKEEIVEPIEDVLVDENKPKKNNSKLIIIIISIIVALVIVLILSLLLFKDNNEQEEITTPNYEKIINEYGKHIEKIIEDYQIANNSTPIFEDITDSITYKKHDVSCKINNIYSDGSVYLNDCKVDNTLTKYSYGKEQEIKEGKKISIYKISYNDGYASYVETKENNSTLVGTITCKTEMCDFISAYDKYVVIKEDSSYYLYNYESDDMEFGPFNITHEYMLSNNILSHNGKVYGIYYNTEGINNIYNVNTSKTLKNVKGTPVVGEYYYDPSVIYKYNYIAMDNNGKTDFVSLKSGNISFSIKETLGKFIEDTNEKIVYILGYTDEVGEFKIYNINGKLLFNGEVFKEFKVGSEKLLVATDTKFKVYDKNLKLETSSKKYDKVLGIYEDFVVVTLNNTLKILSINDKEYVTFKEEWDENKYVFYSDLSGWKTIDGNDAINIVFENKDLTGSYINFYYIPKTKESGIY